MCTYDLFTQTNKMNDLLIIATSILMKLTNSVETIIYPGTGIVPGTPVTPFACVTSSSGPQSKDGE